jgi:hypothetical protein
MIKNGAGKVSGLLAVLALVPDPRRPRGRRYRLVFVLAVAAACTLAGAKTFREIGDQAADLSQNVLRDLGGRRHPLTGPRAGCRRFSFLSNCTMLVGEEGMR